MYDEVAAERQAKKRPRHESSTPDIPVFDEESGLEVVRSRTGRSGRKPRSRATKMVINFTDVPENNRKKYNQRPLPNDVPRDRNTGEELSMNKKAIRNRMRRQKSISQVEFEKLYKPLDEWDAEELARGRPRNSRGTFAGRPPEWVTRAFHEEAMGRFKALVREEMNSHTIEALKTVQLVLEDNERDEKGRPIVAASTKLDAAKFLIEHVLGKPKQHIEQDISVKLQGILAAATLAPGQRAAQPGALPSPAAIPTSPQQHRGNAIAVTSAETGHYSDPEAVLESMGLDEDAMWEDEE